MIESGMSDYELDIHTISVIPHGSPLESAVCGNVALVGSIAMQSNILVDNGLQREAGDCFASAVQQGDMRHYERLRANLTAPFIRQRCVARDMLWDIDGVDYRKLVEVLDGFTLRDSKMEDEFARLIHHVSMSDPLLLGSYPEGTRSELKKLVSYDQQEDLAR